MTFNAQIRGFRPRPWKTKGGEQRYSGTYVILDLSDRPVMETLELEREFPNEAELIKQGSYVGKRCTVVCTGLRTGVDGEPRFTGEIEAVVQGDGKKEPHT